MLLPKLLSKYVDMWKRLFQVLGSCSNALLNFSALTLLALAGLYCYTSISLPDVRQLRTLALQIPLRVYSSDGLLIGEFGEQYCEPVRIGQIPQTLIDAVLDVEDQRFFEHKGVDFYGLVRAAKQLVASGKKLEGGSTITMQLARNYFLSREKSFIRKINEILLAFNIDKYFSKREILELYLNKIYFGRQAYGIAAAAQVYYNRELSDLTIAQQAMLAGLPQAPSRNNPINNPTAALERRNHVLLRMYENGHLTRSQYQTALVEPNSAAPKHRSLELEAHYVAEMVRQELYSRYGKAAYCGGYEVVTTVDSKLQQIAGAALCNGLLQYDRRHGYRGVEGNLGALPLSAWPDRLAKFRPIGPLQIAAVLSTSSRGQQLQLLLADQRRIMVERPPSWSYRWFKGDLVWVYAQRPTTADGNSRSSNDNERIGHVNKDESKTELKWQIGQLPAVEGAIVVMKPNSGEIVALQGGFSYQNSKFNRITSAERQMGSLFKPFLYSAALAAGYNLAGIINDVPLVIQIPGQPVWRPQNASGYFYGPTTLRTALVQSRNLVTIRLLQQLGVKPAISYIQHFGFMGNTELPPSLSLALGAGTTTPLKIATAYLVFANGGYKVQPFIIKRVVQRTPQGTKLIYRAAELTAAAGDAERSYSRVISAQNCYLINDVLHEVVERGTARRVKTLGRKDLMGKTGSTNDLVDAWFVGYNPELLGLVWVGFDQPRSTGEYGSAAALPIWIDFMRSALAGVPEQVRPTPPGIVTALVDKTTGRLLSMQPSQEGKEWEEEDVYVEKFIDGQLPPSEASEVWDEDDFWQRENEIANDAPHQQRGLWNHDDQYHHSGLVAPGGRGATYDSAATRDAQDDELLF